MRQSTQSDKVFCSPCPVCWTQTTKQKEKNPTTRDLYFGSTYLILWNDDLGQALEIPQNQKQALSDPCKTQKEKAFFNNSEVFCFLCQSTWQLTTFCTVWLSSKHFQGMYQQTLFPHLNLIWTICFTFCPATNNNVQITVRGRILIWTLFHIERGFTTHAISCWETLSR